MITEEKFNKYANIFFPVSSWDSAILSHDDCKDKDDDDFIFYRLNFLSGKFPYTHKVALIQISDRLGSDLIGKPTSYNTIRSDTLPPTISKEMSQYIDLYDSIYIKCKINGEEVLFKKIAYDIKSTIMKLLSGDTFEISVGIKAKDILKLPDKTRATITNIMMTFYRDTNYRKEYLEYVKRVKYKEKLNRNGLKEE